MPVRVVVVEDEPALRELLHLFLDMEGFAVEVLGNPRAVEGLEPSTSPTLFLLDLMLPGISGIELAQQLRDRGFVSTPIIGMSASRLRAKVADASGVFDAVLVKPFDLHSLAECMRSLAATPPRQGAIHP